jgi:hypothetical protein
MHCHCAGIGAGDSGCFISKSMRGNWRYGFYLKSFCLNEEELKREGDSLCIRKIARQISDSVNVDGAVVLAFDAVFDTDGEIDYSQTQMYVPNRFVREEVSKFQGLYFGASVNPWRKDALHRLDWCKEAGAKLIKWIPSIQYIDPSDPNIRSFYLKLVELDLPLLTHTGDEHSFVGAANSLADPYRLRFPLECGVKVIAAHTGSSGRNQRQHNFDRVVDLMEEFPNLYSDISALNLIQRQRFLKKILRLKPLHHKMLYGTDYPLINTPLVSPFFYPFRLGWKMIRTIRKLDNIWDRDFVLKRALGLPGMIFQNSGELLDIR